MNDLRRQFHYANVSLAVTIPTLLVGSFLLRHASPAVYQAFGLSVFFLGLGLMLVLQARGERRRRRGPR